MKKSFLSFCIILFLTSCSINPFATPTITPTSTLIPTSTSTPKPTATPTITPSPTPDLPTSWDDPEVIASIRSDFEKQTGMTVEDYYHKAEDDGWMAAHSADQYFNDSPFVDSAQNGIVLGTRLIETNNGNYRHLVLYLSRRNNQGGVSIYPFDVAFEKNGVFTQTTMDTRNETTNPNLYMYEEPLIYNSLDDVAKDLNQEIGKNLFFDLLIRFKDLDSCTLPQGRYIGNVPEVYWEYAGSLCQTPGNYINTASQELIKLTIYRNECPQTYYLDDLMKQGVPDAGFIPLIIAIDTTDYSKE